MSSRPGEVARARALAILGVGLACLPSMAQPGPSFLPMPTAPNSFNPLPLPAVPEVVRPSSRDGGALPSAPLPAPGLSPLPPEVGDVVLGGQTGFFGRATPPPDGGWAKEPPPDAGTPEWLPFTARLGALVGGGQGLHVGLDAFAGQVVGSPAADAEELRGWVGLLGAEALVASAAAPECGARGLCALRARLGPSLGIGYAQAPRVPGRTSRLARLYYAQLGLVVGLGLIEDRPLLPGRFWAEGVARLRVGIRFSLAGRLASAQPLLFDVSALMEAIPFATSEGLPYRGFQAAGVLGVAY